MPNYALRAALIFVACITAPSLPPQVWADDLDQIRFGDNARTYAAGSIQRTTPHDGIVNVITGDNQTVGDRMIVGQRDTLYLRLKNPGDAAIGDLFTIYKRVRKVFHPNTREYLGYLVNRLAIVRVIQTDRELTTTHVLRAYGAVAPGDPVMKFVSPSEGTGGPDQPAPAEVNGRVVEFQSDMGVMQLVAQRNVVYVDRGWQDGVRAGDRMEVVRYGNSLPSRVVGELKILSTEEKTATALITKSTSRILLGDRFHIKAQAAEAIPASQPAQMGSTASPTTNPSPSAFHVENAARETRFSLSDLMKQLRYESGEAKIKPEGYQVLDQLIVHLKTAGEDQLIRVEGHADNMEIGPSLKSMYPTNWDLSKARASGVLRYLIEKGGIDSAKLSSVGYGDTKPVASNATELGRQRNRRVDIVVYKPESTGAPAETSVTPNETADPGYNVSRLGEKENEASGAPSAATADPGPAAPVSPTRADSPSVPVEPVPDTKPTPAVGDTQDQMPATGVVPPPQ